MFTCLDNLFYCLLLSGRFRQDLLYNGIETSEIMLVYLVTLHVPALKCIITCVSTVRINYGSAMLETCSHGKHVHVNKNNVMFFFIAFRRNIIYLSSKLLIWENQGIKHQKTLPDMVYINQFYSTRHSASDTCTTYPCVLPRVIPCNIQYKT